ncbi:hypothetical protein VE25_05685 [Devosia geojensis]|uniref:Uncharacterized protein n=1 Tax=Devosia geojensis TaxID=443610 RepID=A0A0F5FVY4_9HYPH|nr:hypothetical protein [Devosia geojensis]KKB12725.1 hypothetical protein VE25_05685 [Devosia geojensis]
MSGKKIGARAQGQHGAKSVGPDDGVERLDEFDLASDIKGRNSLQGLDQERANSQRQAQAGEKGETDGLIESFEKLDKDERARRDLGKRN